MDLELFILNWFSERTGLDRDNILEKQNENYFNLGWMDSFGFIMFLSELESNFKIELDVESFQDRNFSTIKGLIDIVSQMKE